MHEASILGYILWRTGCLHPFRISRILALAELHYMESTGVRMTSFKYVKGPGVFYIEGLKEMLKGNQCFRVNEDRHCIEYVCEGEPGVPGEYRALLDRAIEEASGLSDRELNNLVVTRKLYDQLFK